jgi:signal transduction histidine kinase
MTKYSFNILILEEQAVTADLLKDELDRVDIPYKTSQTATVAEFEARLVEFAPDLILARHSLPDCDGIAALAAARQQCSHVPFIFICAAAEMDTAFRALRLGATDYVLQGWMQRLGHTVRRVLGEVAERKRISATLHEMEQRTERLQTANEELQSFCFSVSHDLRAPLRHVLHSVELLQKDAGLLLSERNLGHLANITQTANWMGNMIDDLLEFSRMGQTELRKNGVNLNLLVREALLDFQKEMKDRDIDWEIRPLPPVQADRALLRMVLVNLISNALKFTGDRAQAKIIIGCAPSNDSETVIFVSDNGAGFDPRHAAKLFNVFQRLHSQEDFAGTGVGLATVRRIIHRHGGQTWAQGAVEGGATFYFSLPSQTVA